VGAPFFPGQKTIFLSCCRVSEGKIFVPSIDTFSFTFNHYFMSVLLEIPDGNPWYLSPNIWTVPGDDPTAAPGIPVAGENCYVYARVTNNGTDPVTDATVNFYWANPSVGFDRSTANFIGQSYVSLDPSETEDVLCLQPWSVILENGGHECVLAEAFKDGVDPLPAGLAFNVPTDRHVAQRNFSILTTMSAMFSFSFEIHNAQRLDRSFNISVTEGKPDSIEKLKPTLGKGLELPLKPGKVLELGFVDKTCPTEHDLSGASKELTNIPVKPFGKVRRTVVGRLEGQSALLQVTQKSGDVVVGGLSFLVVHHPSKK
jgi:hypothetical protein